MLRRVYLGALLAVVPLVAETGTLRLRVEARTVSPVTADPPKTHWVLVGDPRVQSFPSASAGSKIAAELVRVRGQLLSPSGQCSVQVLFVAHGCNPLVRIEGEDNPIDGFSRIQVMQPDELAEQPTAEAGPRDVIVTVEYSQVAAVLVQRISASVATDSWDSRANERLTAFEIDYPRAVKRLGATGFDDLKAVTIKVQYTKDDLVRSRRRPKFTEDNIRDALLRVAILALHEIRARGVAPGKPAPPESLYAELDDKIKGLLNPLASRWPIPAVSVQRSSDSTAIEITIQRVRVVAVARIDVQRGQIENEKGDLASFHGKTKQAEQEIREDIRQTEATLNRDFQPRLEAMEGTVPEQAAVESLTRELAGRKELRGGVRANGFGGNLVFGGDRRWVLGKLDAKLGVNAAFTAEDLFSGEGTMTGERLLYNWLGRDIGETYSFSLRGGQQTQSTEFVFGLPRSRGERSALTYGADLTASYSRDTNQKIGAFTRDPSRHLLERDKGLVSRAYAELRRSGVESNWTYLARAESLYDWRHLLLEPGWTAARLTDGQLAAPTLRLRQAIKRETNAKSAGIERLSFSVKADGRKGTRALGGDFAFRQYSLDATVETLFGARTPRDFLLRYRRGLGVASAGTPLFQIFRMGGGAYLRGIEEGEFVGRGIGLSQADAGVSARFLWSLVHRPKAGAPPAGGTGQPDKSPVSLDRIYAIAFYDRSNIVQQPRIGDLISLRKPFWGRGIGAELRGLGAGTKRANLSIGYARSPQSVVHRKGLMTLGVGFDF